jgi:hypothetical protein
MFHTGEENKQILHMKESAAVTEPLVHDTVRTTNLSIQTSWFTHLFESIALCSNLFIKLVISHKVDVLNAVGSCDGNIASPRLQFINLQQTMHLT